MDRKIPDADLRAQIRHAIDTKTKPVGSLGRVETLAAQIAEIQGTVTPYLDGCELTIFAADHGVAADGVSAYPQAVTRQMVENFLAGGAASTVFAATFGVPVRVVDAGVAGAPIENPGLLSRRIAPGTASFLSGPAMSAEQAERALSEGRRIGNGPVHLAAAFGEMGIGNTASASLLAHKIAGLPLESIVGRGTGLDDKGLERKREILARAAARTPERLAASDALCEYGGFEIAMMAGAMRGAAEAGRMVLVDGFIASAAALLAQSIDPAVRRNFVFAHASAEQGHRAILDFLEADPVLSLDMRLGEGTGALLAWPILRAATAMLTEMASFESAGVSGPA
ncbi:nicotinate-nucleotide--dimethylbenzimidazole phosphoribosyltransferase [Amaricoccus macauensis]|uniref:nicotinate-nucleotide--dimethylbenzimidazole phosphoribosyltransferase n=1 Tax=Amaricoccus macauensis TaxID=57001 RepID=UPI003C7D072C